MVAFLPVPEKNGKEECKHRTGVNDEATEGEGGIHEAMIIRANMKKSNPENPTFNVGISGFMNLPYNSGRTFTRNDLRSMKVTPCLFL